MNVRFGALACVAIACSTGTARAHHTYAMFDASKPASVSGTVARLEWINPHVFIWVYVASAANKGKYDLYAFENASPNVLELNGWSRTALKAGETVTVEYAPLRDGRPGGHCIRLKLAQERVLPCAGGPAGRPRLGDAVGTAPTQKGP